MASGGLVVVVLQYSRLLEPSLSRDRLSGILPCLLLSLAYGSSPEMPIVDLIHLVEHVHECLAPTVASLLQNARNKEIGIPMWSLGLALSIGVSWYDIVPFPGNRLRP